MESSRSQETAGTESHIKGFDISFSLFGFGLYLAWWWMLFNTARVFPLTGDVAAAYHGARLLGMLIQTITLGVLVILHRKSKSTAKSSQYRTIIFASTTGACSSILLATGRLLSFPINVGLAAIGWIGVGITGGVLTLLWVKLYSAATTRNLCLYICGSIALGTAITYVLCYLPLVATTVLVVLLSPASALSMSCGTKHISLGHGNVAPVKETRRFSKPLIRLLLSVFVYTLIYAALINPLSTRRGAGLEANGCLMLVAPLLAALMIFTLVWISKTDNLGIVYRWTLPILVVALIMFPFATGVSLYAAGFIGSFGFECFNVIAWVILLDFANHCGLRPLRTLIIGRLVYSAGMLVGSAIGSCLALLDLFHATTIFTGLCMGSVVVLVCMTTIMLHESELLSKDPGTDRAEQAFDVEALMKNIPSAEDIFNDKVEKVTSRYPLTPREKEVFALLAHGRSNKYIEEKLFISEHTVDSHVTHIYRKCGVHSRQEIINMVEAERPTDENPYAPIGTKMD